MSIPTPHLIAVIAASATLAAACTDDGGVELRLLRPGDPALDPFAQTIGELTLTATVEGEAAALYRATRPLLDRNAPLEFGEVPVADQVRFELAGAAPSGRLLAFGRSGAPVDVRVDRVVEVSVLVRRPWVYLAGADQLLAIDATGGPGEDYAHTIEVGAPVSAAAVTPDGAAVVVATAAGLALVSTSTHLPLLLDPVALPGPAEELAVSPDGRWAVLTHNDPAATGVSIVDLAAMRSGAAVAAAWVEASSPGAVVIAGDSAWVVQDRLDNLFCAGASSLLAIPLADPAAVGPALALDTVASDLAYEPVTGVLLVVEPCGDGKVLTVSGAGAVPNLLLSVPGASAVAVAGGRVWAMGHVDGEGAHLILASIPIGGGEPEVLHFPTLEESAVATALAQDGQDGVLQMTADFFSSSELAVLPDGEHVAILGAAIYLSEPIGSVGFGGTPIVPALTMVTYEYQLVDLDTGLGAQRLRTSCAIQWEPGALLDDFTCTRAPGQDETAVSFVPRGLTALYGSR